MKTLQNMNRSELMEYAQQQAQENRRLRCQVQELEQLEIASLQREIDELRQWKEEAEAQIVGLRVAAAMAQGLLLMTGLGLVALVGEQFGGLLRAISEKLGQVAEGEREKLNGQSEDAVTKLIAAIKQLDGISRQAWDRRMRQLELRAATLPPLKKALFNALASFAHPTRLGSQLLDFVLNDLRIGAEIVEEVQDDLEALATLLDELSNLWPLAAVNSLVPLLKYVGWDDAAEAAGEILDYLENDKEIPRPLIPRVKPDLIDRSAVDKRTKATTIVALIKDGYALERSGKSPVLAAELGCVPSSTTQLKRAQKVYRALKNIYERGAEQPQDDDLEYIDMFGQKILETLQAQGDVILAKPA